MSVVQELYIEVAKFYGISVVELQARLVKGEPLIHEWRVKTNDDKVCF